MPTVATHYLFVMQMLDGNPDQVCLIDVHVTGEIMLWSCEILLATHVMGARGRLYQFKTDMAVFLVTIALVYCYNITECVYLRL